MPETLPRAKRLYHVRLSRASARKAQRVIAVSHQTADDLMHYWQIPSDKIVVVPNGVDQRFRPGAPDEVAAFRQERELPARFLLYLGTLEPRKNLDLLLEAFARWIEQAPARNKELTLVLAGGRGWFYERIFAQAEALGLSQRVIFPGFIPDGDLHRWYQAAEGFIYPSLFEGFGLPVLEAMACGTPVLCSDAPSLMEVAGDCALTFPVRGDATQSRDELVNGISLMVDQPYLRDELRQRGLARSELFSWQRTAAHTIEVYESLP
jgi:glycosyltransferase involved in cell wall biosynthesis